VTSKLIPKLKSLKELSEVDNNSIFYRGIDNIQEALNAIRKDNGNFRVAVFIENSEPRLLMHLEIRLVKMFGTVSLKTN
jgi:hypothetical protein